MFLTVVWPMGTGGSGRRPLTQTRQQTVTNPPSSGRSLERAAKEGESPVGERRRTVAG